MVNSDTIPGNPEGNHADYTSSPVNRKPSTMQSVIEWARIIVIAILISLPIRFFVAEPFIVNGASMDPTFSTGQFLIVDRLTYRISEPSRGDVIVFAYPNDPRIYYIKRIIGLPGETLNIENGIVTVNHSGLSNSGPQQGATPTEILSEPYVEDSHRSHENFHVTLGPTEYFVMGDNRAQSSDSRVWGSLDRHFIVGRPVARLLPVNDISILPGQYHDKNNTK